RRGRRKRPAGTDTKPMRKRRQVVSSLALRLGVVGPWRGFFSPPSTPYPPLRANGPADGIAPTRDFILMPPRSKTHPSSVHHGSHAGVRLCVPLLWDSRPCSCCCRRRRRAPPTPKRR